jgi:hypothetical protein
MYQNLRPSADHTIRNSGLQYGSPTGSFPLIINRLSNSNASTKLVQLVLATVVAAQASQRCLAGLRRA